MKTTRQSFQMIAHCLFTSIDSIEKSQEIRMQVKIFECGIFTTTLSDCGFQKKRKNEHGRTSMLLKSTQFMPISETPHGHGQQKRKQPHILPRNNAL
jgi:hypothetical protein